MYFIGKTEEFNKWIKKLRDLRAKAKILIRIQKLENDEHFGDSKPVGDGVIELRIHYAKGYRVYLKEYEGRIIVLLIGGDKSTQQKDVAEAKELARNIEKKEDGK